MSASTQPSLCQDDVDDHHQSRVTWITKGLLSSPERVDINESALLINISFRDASTGGFHCSTGDIELVYKRKLGS
jgi:hypothetical protein